jgi:hypothetical protein
MGIPLEPLTAQDVGQAAGKEGHRQDEEEQVKHIEALSTNRVLDRALWLEMCNALEVKMPSKDAPVASRLYKSSSAPTLLAIWSPAYGHLGSMPSSC